MKWDAGAGGMSPVVARGGREDVDRMLGRVATMNR